MFVVSFPVSIFVGFFWGKSMENDGMEAGNETMWGNTQYVVMFVSASWFRGGGEGGRGGREGREREGGRGMREGGKEEGGESREGGISNLLKV